jgi:hypothetical protein
VRRTGHRRGLIRSFRHREAAGQGIVQATCKV